MIYGEIVDTLHEQLSANGYDVTLICETEITPEDTEDKDLCITLGGDNTFLKTSLCLKNLTSLPYILGVNCSPMMQVSKLCEVNMEYSHLKSQVSKIIDCLDTVGTERETDNVEFYNRHRMLMTIMRYDNTKPSHFKTISTLEAVHELEK